MAKISMVSICVGLVLTFSGPSFAAKPVHNSGKSQYSAGRFSNSAIGPNSRDPQLNGREDPYAPGVNWPGKW